MRRYFAAALMAGSVLTVPEQALSAEASSQPGMMVCGANAIREYDSLVAKPRTARASDQSGFVSQTYRSGEQAAQVLLYDPKLGRICLTL